MGILWAARSDNSNFDARYSPAGLRPAIFGQPAFNAIPVYSVDATAIGGNVYDLDRAGTLSRALVYPGRGIFTNQAFSILMRVKTSALTTSGLLEIGCGPSLELNKLVLYWVGTDWRIILSNQTQQFAANAANIYTTGITLNTWVDVVLTWDGTTTANALKLWLDGTNVGSLTAAVAATSPRSANYTTHICVGSVDNLFTARYKLNEMVIWDSAINPTSVTLTSGSGSLNGASRTAFVDVTSFDGSVNTSAGAGNIRSGSPEVINGVTITGTVDIPSLANTKTGVAGDGGTGTYDGSDRWTDPGEANVRLATAYKANSTSNNKTGLAAIPSAANTKTGVATDQTTGTYDGSDRWTDPAEANVRLGTAYKANSTSNNKSGLAAIPTAANTKTGVPTDQTTGTYDGSDRWTSPAAGDLRSGIQLKSNSTSLNLTGTLVAPSLADTKIGIAGDGGTGTYDGSDRWSDPGVANVLAPTAYLANAISKIGTMDLSADYTDPGIANVRLNTTYYFLGVLKTGTYAAQATPNPSGRVLKTAFNTLTRLHSQAASLKRLGSPDATTACRITPSNYFRYLAGPAQVTIRGREFIIPKDSILAPFDPILKRGDRLIHATYGTLTIDEIIEMCDIGGEVMGYRCRCE